MATAPWDDCMVAFSVGDGEAIWDKLAKGMWQERLPDGWAPIEANFTGARCVVVFRVRIPKPPTLASDLQQIAMIRQAAVRAGGVETIGLVETMTGREVRSYSPAADAYVLSLLTGST